MPVEEKQVMSELYQQVKSQQGLLLGADTHDLILRASSTLKEELSEYIYEHRVLAETRISRPTMKAFKAKIRQNGLLSL